MVNNVDFYETEEATQLANAYNNEIFKGKNLDWLFLICLFLTLNI